MLEAARRRGQAADHLLFAGPPGLGKTTLAGIVAAEMGVHLHVTSGPALERAGDLAAILTKLEDGDVLFIDEIHRLSRAVEEILYPAMEDFQLDIVVGKGPAASSIRLTLPPFTLVGATTRTGMITGPLRDRFGLVARLDYYDDDELEAIVERAARILDVHDRPRRGVGDRPPVARHAAHRQPAAAPCARLRRGARRRHDRRGRGPGGARRCSASTTAASTRSTGRSSRRSAPVRRRPGRALHAGDQRRRAARDGRGRVRAVPHPAGHDRPHPARSRRPMPPTSTSASPRPAVRRAPASSTERDAGSDRRVSLALRWCGLPTSTTSCPTSGSPRRRSSPAMPPGCSSTEATRHRSTATSATCPICCARATCSWSTRPGSSRPASACSARPGERPRCCCSSRATPTGGLGGAGATRRQAARSASCCTRASTGGARR